MAATKGLGTTGNGAGVVTPLDHKLAQAGLIAKTGAGSNLIRPGLFYDGVANIVLGKANMSYDVVAFTAVTTRGGAAGAVLLTNDGVVNVTTTAAPGSNSRIDSVYLWPREFSLDGSNSDPVIGVVQGTAAVSPVAPSLAGFPGAIELARITVAAGAVATNGAGVTITQTAPFTTLDGGMLVRRTTAERDAISSPAETLLCYVLADKITYRYNGTAWKAWSSDWIAYTPTLANVTLGTGATTAYRYRYVGGVIEVEFRIVLGTGGAMGTFPTMTLPVNSQSLLSRFEVRGNDITIFDVSAATPFPGAALANDTDVDKVRFYHTNTGAFTNLQAAVPFLWAVGDVLAGRFSYIPA